jgi:hypothetical protein
VAPVFELALRDQVAIGEQHRVRGLVGAQRDGVARHHVRAVEEVGDAPKTLGLALREKGALAHVQAHEPGVFGGRAGGEDFELEGLVARGQVFEHELVAVDLEAGALAVDEHAREVQFLAVEAQRLRGYVGVAAHAHAIEYARLGRVEVEAQIDAVDPKGRRGIVLAPGDGGLGFTHSGFHCIDFRSCLRRWYLG